MNLNDIQKIAAELGYSQLNELQQKAFAEASTFDRDQNLMVIGPTSSGKTLVPKLLYYARVLEAVREGVQPPKMLFVVPYRALAAQKVSELRDEFNRVFGSIYTLTCEQSTSEYRQADTRIQKAEDIDIGVTINEKAFVFASSDPEFLKRYQMIVFDEIGLLKDENRGIKLDFLMTWIRFLQKGSHREPLQMIALGTPFYDWSGYAENFGFREIRAESRPTLKEWPVYVRPKQNSKTRQTSIEYSVWSENPKEEPYRLLLLREASSTPPSTFCPEDAVESCPATLSCRMYNAVQPCTSTGKRCPYRYRLTDPGIPDKYTAIAELCRHHLEQGHQILIFWNNRFEVRSLSAYLYRYLSPLRNKQKEPLLEELPGDLKACKQRVLDDCTKAARAAAPTRQKSVAAFTEDELAGVFADENGDDYRAYCTGIGFHSSALPPEMRAAIETDFLGNEPHLRIVCSTETLAYGINSAVDVVIVADLHKNDMGTRVFLKPIEYQNYIGRAGRMRPGKKLEETIGYVYPVIDAPGPHTRRDILTDDPELRGWQNLKAACTHPEPIYSAFYSQRGNDYVPFMLLCLIPAAEDGRISSQELLDLLQLLPHRGQRNPKNLEQMLGYLMEQGLIEEEKISSVSSYYTATERGKKLKGYTPSRHDYDCLLHAMQFAWDPEHRRLDSAALIYELLKADCLSSQVYALRLPEKLFGLFSAGNIRLQLAMYGCGKALQFVMDKIPYRELEKFECRRRLIITAAVLTWAETSDPRLLNDLFYVNYPLLQALTRELSYLLTIAEHSLYALEEELDGEEALEQQRSLQSLERSTVYGFPPEYYECFHEFFRRYADPQRTPRASQKTHEDAARILTDLTDLQPSSARWIRSVVLDCEILHRAWQRDTAQNAPYGGSSPLRTLKALQHFNKDYTELWRICVREILQEQEPEDEP